MDSTTNGILMEENVQWIFVVVLCGHDGKGVKSPPAWLSVIQTKRVIAGA